MFLLLFSAILVQAHTSDCRISPQQERAYLKMSYQDFDQQPNGGWRIESKKKCLAVAARLIDLYRLVHSSSLNSADTRILYWHSAQLYGMLGQMELARPRFEKSLNPNESSNSPVRWNSYVRGTVAFFESDLPSLKAARNSVALDGEGSLNLAILDGMIRCFDLPRIEAYSEKCR